MNVLITGSSGQLGTKFKECVKDPTFTPFYTDSKTLDITDEAAVRKYIIDNEIDVILNCAAYTNVDKAEEEEEKARLVNTRAVGYLAKAIKERNGYLIHISTDYVFENNGAIPRKPNGMDYKSSTWYGITKRWGEILIQDSGCHYLIFRTSWLYSNVGKNFVKTMYNHIKNCKQLKVVYDQVGSPTNAGEFALFLYKIINNKEYEGKDGIYHFANLGVASWYDFTIEIAIAMGKEYDNIYPCLSSEYPTKAKRPNYSVLDVSKTIKTFNYEPQYWKKALYGTINELEKEDYEK